MQPITISLDAETHRLAKEKTNFSSWVRDKLRSERNQMPIAKEMAELQKQCDFFQKQSDLFYDILMRERDAREKGDEQ